LHRNISKEKTSAMERKSSGKILAKTSEVFLFGFSLAAIPLLGYCLRFALILYRAVYPEIYNRTIVGQTEVPFAITSFDKFFQISRELWLLLVFIVILGVLLLLAIAIVSRGIIFFITQLNLFGRR